MTYQERLYQAATRFSEERNERKWRENSDAKDFEHESIIAVAMQADAIMEVWIFMYQGDGSAQSLESHSKDGEYYLKQNGYIPEKEEE